jgi:4-hydroxybenzoate polyprenyltransferase
MHRKPDYRVGRTLMLGLVTGATAFGLSGVWTAALVALGLGLALALAGFYLDHLVDMTRDGRSEHNVNPLSRGLLKKPLAMALIGLGLASVIILAVIFQPLALIPAGGVILIVLLLAAPFQRSPLFRAAGLGLLQALYAIVGGFAAGGAWLSVCFIAGFLFFAMAGGKVLGDVRDMPQDKASGLATIPLTYGLGFSRVFLLTFECAAYAVGIAAFFICGFRWPYLVLMLFIACGGTVLNVYFCFDPTPARADRANKLSFALLGMLFVAAMTIEGLLRL